MQKIKPIYQIVYAEYKKNIKRFDICKFLQKYCFIIKRCTSKYEKYITNTAKGS